MKRYDMTSDYYSGQARPYDSLHGRWVEFEDAKLWHDAAMAGSKEICELRDKVAELEQELEFEIAQRAF